MHHLRTNQPSRVAILAALAPVLVALWGLAATPADAQTTRTFTIVVDDPNGPDESHVFRWIDGPAPVSLTDGESSATQLAVGEAFNVRPAALPGNMYSEVVCDNASIDVVDSVVRGTMPNDDVTCTFVTAEVAFGPSTLTVNTVAVGGGALQQFAYDLTADVNASFSHFDGETTELVVNAEDYVYIQSTYVPDWPLADAVCTGVASFDSWSSGVSFDVVGGQSAECTFTYVSMDQPVPDNRARLFIGGDTPPQEDTGSVTLSGANYAVLNLDDGPMGFLYRYEDIGNGFGDVFITDSQLGWDVVVICNGPYGPVIDGFVPLEIGFETVCTVVPMEVGTANLTVEFDIPDFPNARYRIEPFTNSPVGGTAPPLTAEFTARQEFDFSLVSPWYVDVEGTCSGDNGALTVNGDHISGRLEAGADVTCVFTGTAVDGAVPMTLITGGAIDGSGFSIFHEGGPAGGRTTDQFQISSGETYTLWVQPSAVTSFYTGNINPTNWYNPEFQCNLTSDDDVEAWLGKASYFNPVSGMAPADVEPFTCTIFYKRWPRGGSQGPDGGVVVSCLAGNGRVDVNVLNESDEPVAYIATVGSLAPKEWTVAAGDWGRRSVTGRPDGELRVRVWENDVPVYSALRNVGCDSAAPEVTGPEVRVLNACRSGDGFVAWLFANPTDAKRGYVIEFGDLPNRSTTAQAHGQTVRGVSGRPDGTYDYVVRIGTTVIEESSVTVDCDE